jgi:hypothetical protein
MNTGANRYKKWSEAKKNIDDSPKDTPLDRIVLGSSQSQMSNAQLQSKGPGYGSQAARVASAPSLPMWQPDAVANPMSSSPESTPMNQVKSSWNTNAKPVIIPNWAKDIDRKLDEGRLSNYNVVRLGSDENGNYKFMSNGEAFMILAPGNDISNYPEYVPVQVDAYKGVGAYRLRDGTESGGPGMWDSWGSVVGPKTPDHNGYYAESLKAAQDNQQVQRLLELMNSGVPIQDTRATGDYTFGTTSAYEMLQGLFGGIDPSPTPTGSIIPNGVTEDMVDSRRKRDDYFRDKQDQYDKKNKSSDKGKREK